MQSLTKRENEILALIKQGKTYLEIQSLLGINQCCLHTHASRIMRKTGIASLKEISLKTRHPNASPPPSSRQLFQLSPRVRATGPTPAQMAVLRLIAQGGDYKTIAAKLGVGVQTVQNAASNGCARAGIVGQGHNRTKAIRAYLAGEKVAPVASLNLDDY